MLELKFRKRDEYGQIILTEEGIINLLYSGELDLSDIKVENSTEIQLYNKWANLYDEELITIYTKPEESIEEVNSKRQSVWFIPEKYKIINVEKYLLDNCTTLEEKNRVKNEMVLFRERGMEIILRVLIYLVDIMRENNIVWGVGRGSACASYSLYIIGIHKIDSLRYNLDIKEFLK